MHSFKGEKEYAIFSNDDPLPFLMLFSKALFGVIPYFFKNLKTARVWGKDVYDGQLVGRDHILHDKDIVEMHL